MRSARVLALAALLSTLVGAESSCDGWRVIGDPGNPPDSTPTDTIGSSGLCADEATICQTDNECDRKGAPPPCSKFEWPARYQRRGSVPYVYEMKQLPVSVAEWVIYLNATQQKADRRALIEWTDRNRPVASHPPLLEGELGSYRALEPGLPWPYANRDEAMRYANWKGTSDPDLGAYDCTGEHCRPVRRPGARIALPTVDEWRKAAGWDPASRTWWEFPGQGGAPPEPGVDANVAWSPDWGPWGNCFGAGTGPYPTAPCRIVPVGSYPQYASPWGVQDLCGNGMEISESPGETFGEIDPDQMILEGIHPWLTALDCRSPNLQQGRAHAGYNGTKIRLVRLRP